MAEQTDGQKEVAEYERQQRSFALQLIRQLKAHCVLNIPGNSCPPEVKALIYSELTSIAKLYEPERATL